MTQANSKNQSVPYSFDKDSEAAGLHDEFSSLSEGEGSGVNASVAGRVLLRRNQGNITFAQMADASGTIQLFAQSKNTPEYEQFTNLSLGDWVGVKGEVIKTKRGELSVRVDEWVLLAKTQKPFPEKWHGLSDQDLRYRQRWLDLWVNRDVAATFKDRSRIISSLRSYLEGQGFLEVETPILQPLPGGADARPFETHHNSLDMDMYLRVAPELYLKRLVVGGFEKVFEIGRVFRNEGLSPRHNPEFTMMEAYVAYADYHDIMELTENLICSLAKEIHGGLRIPARESKSGDEKNGEEKNNENSEQKEINLKTLDIKTPWRRATIYELVLEHCGKEIDIDMGAKQLAKIAKDLGVETESKWGAGKLVLEIYEKTTEPNLVGPVFVCDYPAEVSPLARQHRDKPGLVERFELIINGNEIANAFSELNDSAIQAERFSATHQDEDEIRFDKDYISALEYGLPPTGGLGIGIDRLVMLLTGAKSIRDVLLFPTLKPAQE